MVIFTVFVARLIRSLHKKYIHQTPINFFESGLKVAKPANIRFAPDAEIAGDAATATNPKARFFLTDSR